MGRIYILKITNSVQINPKSQCHLNQNPSRSFPELDKLVIKLRRNLKGQNEDIGNNLLDIGLGNHFLALTPQARAIKTKINKWDYVKPKSFYIVKKPINKMKRQPIQWEKIFANHISDKGFI